jgi:FkbM family methyltransferase
MKPPPGIEALPNGQWVIEGDTHLSAWAKQKGTIVTDPWVFKFLSPYVSGVNVIWDIGACIGDHTRCYLDWGAEVIAFEPNPPAFACLVHNCPDATCYNVAASDRDGTLSFTQLDNAGASRIVQEGEWSVDAVALDDFPVPLPAPGFVKIDCEGWEPNVITGMAGIITHHKPILFVEINEGALNANGFTGEGLRDLVKSLGYRTEILYPSKAKPGDPQFDCLFLP